MPDRTRFSPYVLIRGARLIYFYSILIQSNLTIYLPYSTSTRKKYWDPNQRVFWTAPVDFSFSTVPARAPPTPSMHPPSYLRVWDDAYPGDSSLRGSEPCIHESF